MLVGVVYNEEMCAHEGQKGHPEQPARITSIWEAFTKSELADKCVRVPARRATLEELSTVHSANHVKNICCLSYMPYMKSTLDVLRTKYTQNSIYFNHKSFEAATWAAGSVVELSLKVARGEVASGAAIVRPPGHHACPNVAMGFCFFNNVAVAARILSGAKVGEQQMIDARKVLVVDWDVHHGNGTQLTFFREKQVLYFSVHRFDGGEFYPGSYGESRENLLYENGDVDKVGEGDGVGFNVNVPWPGKGFGDADYIAVWKHVLLPIGESFKPDIVLVSAGFDAAEGDEMGECNLTPEGYATLTRMLKTLAGGKVVLALEGGYNLEATSRSFVACLRALTEASVADPPAGKPCQATWEVITKVRQVQSQYWPALTATRPLVVNLNIRHPPHGWVWYATYGSNMWPARVNCYIQGGKVEGAQKSNIGLRDKTLPKDNVWLTFSHRVFFGRRHSNTWGPGGVAFLNPLESQDKAVFRAYKITYEQFNGIFAQENSLDPEKQAGPIGPEVIRALQEAPNFIECIKVSLSFPRVLHVNGVQDVNVWYRAVLYLGEYSDLPVLTITCPPSDVEKYISGELPTCEPSESYRKTILTGLRDHPGLDEASGKKYLDKVTYKVPFKPQPAVTVLPPPSTAPSPLAAALFESPSLTDSVRRDLTHRKRKNTLRRS